MTPPPRRRRPGRAHGTDPATAAWAAEALRQALAHHRAGRAGEAEALYRQVLKRVPRHAHTLNLLAILVYHAGRVGEAKRLVKQALAAAPGMPEAHNTLGNILLDQGRIEMGRQHRDAAVG
ncbi:MAG: tetratricopeptide repeat protein, partial [Kiloniellaceae bacterium]